MKTNVLNSSLNEAQIFLLQAFSLMKSEEEKADIQALLLNYYREKVNSYVNNFSISNEQIDEILNSHYRTPYK